MFFLYVKESFFFLQNINDLGAENNQAKIFTMDSFKQI